MEKGDNYLPRGTVVMLENGIKRVMITGYCFRTENDPKTLWDYTGCLYPEGILVADQLVCFNHSQIGKVYFKGLENKEEKEFMKALKEAAKADANN